MKSIFLSAALLSLLSAISIQARAEDTTQPSTAPAVDVSTPKAAAISLITAFWAGDAAAATACTCDDPAQQKLIAADAKMSGAYAQLQDKLKKRFGHDADEIVAQMPPIPLERIKSAEVIISGDTAIIKTSPTMSDDASPHYRNINGRWLFDMSKTPVYARIAAATQDAEKHARVVNGLIARLDNGDFKTLKDFADAFNGAWH